MRLERLRRPLHVLLRQGDDRSPSLHTKKMDITKTSKVGSDSSSVPPPAPPQAAAQAKNAKGSGKSSVRSANDLCGDDIEMPSPA